MHLSLLTGGSFTQQAPGVRLLYKGGKGAYGSCLLLRFLELFLDLCQSEVEININVFFIQSHGFWRDLLAGKIIPIGNPLMVTTWMSEEVSKLLVNGL